MKAKQNQEKEQLRINIEKEIYGKIKQSLTATPMAEMIKNILNRTYKFSYDELIFRMAFKNAC